MFPAWVVPRVVPSSLRSLLPRGLSVRSMLLCAGSRGFACSRRHSPVSAGSLAAAAAVPLPFCPVSDPVALVWVVCSSLPAAAGYLVGLSAVPPCQCLVSGLVPMNRLCRLSERKLSGSAPSLSSSISIGKQVRILPRAFTRGKQNTLGTSGYIARDPHRSSSWRRELELAGWGPCCLVRPLSD